MIRLEINCRSGLQPVAEAGGMLRCTTRKWWIGIINYKYIVK
jgi:hypothetical protein